VSDFDNFFKGIQSGAPPELAPTLARHARPERILVQRPGGTPFLRIMLAVLVANLLTIILVSAIMLVGIGKVLSSDAGSLTTPDPIAVCYTGGC